MVSYTFFRQLGIRLGLVLLLFSCGKQEEAQEALVLSRIKQVATLSNMEVTMSKIIYGDYEKKFRFLFSSLSLSSEKFVARTRATVKLGVDLNKIQIEDVEVDGDRIRLSLPPIEITSFDYPAEDFEILREFSRNPYRVIGTENIDEFFAVGELTIRDQINRIGLREKAEARTRAFFNQLLSELGFSVITIDFRAGPANRLEELRQFEEFVEQTRDLVLRLKE